MSDLIEKYRVRNNMHQPEITTKVGNTDQGPIMRMTLNGSSQKTADPAPSVEYRTASGNKRKKLTTTFNWNSRIGPTEMGKPDSAMLVARRGLIVIDYLLENDDNQRQPGNNLHAAMREEVDYSDSSPNFGLWSGHLTPMNISTRGTSHVLMMDGMIGKRCYNDLDDRTKKIIDTLHGNRITPITADGFIIDNRLFKQE